MDIDYGNNDDENNDDDDDDVNDPAAGWGDCGLTLVWFPNPLAAGSDFFNSDGDPV